MREITQYELNEIVRLHSLWLKGEEDGKKADLSYKNLTACDLRFADLRYVNLSGSKLLGTNLRKANLTEAKLGSAKLNDTNLEGANLTNADLRNANLIGAKMKGANLQGANFYRAVLLCAKIDNMINVGNLGEDNRTAYYFFKDDRVICDKFDGTLEEFEKKVREKYDEDSDYCMAIEMFIRFRNNNK